MTQVSNRDVVEAVRTAHQADWARVLSATVRFTRNLDLAEDAVQDAFASALTVWERDGIPHNAGAWLTTTSRNRAMDLLRRSQTFQRRLPLLVVEREMETETGEIGQDGFGDERVRLIFTCCHPTLGLEARVALTLRLICGLTTAEIARLFLVSEPTMAARLTRAKKKIAAAAIPYRVPEPTDLPERLPAVLATVFLVFTEGHTAVESEHLERPELARLALVLITTLLELIPGEPEITGLAGLIHLTLARRAARLDQDGEVILLENQDRSLWNKVEIEQGIALVEQALRGSRGRPGPYAVQAAIAAVHAEAHTYEETDWPQILALYNVLLAISPSPVIQLGRAIALGMTEGPEAGLADPPMSPPYRTTRCYLPPRRICSDGAAGTQKRVNTTVRRR